MRCFGCLNGRRSGRCMIGTRGPPEEQSHCEQPRYLKKKRQPVRSHYGCQIIQFLSKRTSNWIAVRQLPQPNFWSQFPKNRGCLYFTLSGWTCQNVHVRHLQPSETPHPGCCTHLRTRTPPIISFEQDFENTLSEAVQSRGFRYLHPNGSRNMRLN